MTATALRMLDAIALLATVGVVAAGWLSFERRMCAMRVGGSCAPNATYLGLAAVALAVAGFAVVLRRRGSGG